MKPTAKPRVKICCIASLEEAWMAIDHGASALGLVSAMPSGPGPIAEDLIAEIAPEAKTRQLMLVDNPARLYGFPTA